MECVLCQQSSAGESLQLQGMQAPCACCSVGLSSRKQEPQKDILSSSQTSLILEVVRGDDTTHKAS